MIIGLCCGCVVTLPSPPRWCPTTPRRRRRCSSGGRSLHTHRNRKNGPSTIPVCVPARPRPAPVPHSRPPAASADHHPVFAKPLKDSLRRASVQISTANADGDLYVWGYIPVVVAKWSVSLLLPPPRSPLPAASISRKTVRPVPVSISPLTPRSHRGRGHIPCQRLRQAHARPPGRIRDAPPRACPSPAPAPAPAHPPQYGKSLDWKNEHYTTHDVASVFRRYLTQMPVSSVRVSARRPLSLP